ncbi:MAG: hypothetical protein ACTTJE_09265 [Schwartzia sp. (in: firmicutes)]
MIDIRVLRVEVAAIVHGLYLRRLKGDILLTITIYAIMSIRD